MQVDAGAAAPKPRTRTTHTPDGKYQFALSEDGLLGTGSHGVVRSARHTTTGEWVAVKLMPASILSSVAKELIAQSTMVHPNIVRLYGTQVDLDKRRVYMVMELATGGELFDRIAECGKLPDAAARRYLTQMVRAVAHCHAQNVYHRDLKPENILLDGADNVKIADFGLAALAYGRSAPIGATVHEDASFLQHTKCGSLMYAAPEVLASTKESGYDAAKADVWSLGIILYSMLSGALPFKVAVPHKCARFALVQQRGSARVLCEANGFSPDATALIEQMLALDPRRRLSAADVLKFPWVGDYQTPPAPSVLAHQKWCALLGYPEAEGLGQQGMETLEAAKQIAAEMAGAGAGVPDGAGAGKRALGGLPEPAHKRPLTGLAPQDPAYFGGDVPTEHPSLAEEGEEVPPGVNGMLVRSLGWVQLETEKEKMVGDVASALDSLGVRYEVVKGELSDVVWVGDDAEALSGDAHASGAVAADASLGEGVPRRTTAGGTPITEGKLCVRMRIQPGEGATSSLDISRHAGDVLQFHSFYRDVRNQLAGVNGWVKDHESGSYQHVVGVPRRATAP